ncbi:MAG: 2-amino-4-hydroxy-6-hydroxymethyldihydropteridine diphosphokinase [Pseudomonadota bacterium]
MTVYLIALGSNLPLGEYDLTSTLVRAIDLLGQARGIEVCRVSAWYRTPAWPEGSGPDYVNGAAALASQLSPSKILQELHGVEKALGRSRRERWASRTCDLDLLGAGELVLPDPETVSGWIDEGPDRNRVPDDLLLPHPRLQERGFVLVPLAEIAPNWTHPILQRTVSEMLSALPASEIAEIRRIEPVSGPG